MRTTESCAVGMRGARHDLSLDRVADVLWTMNSPEYYLMLVRERGWAPEEFERWLADAWRRLLLGG